MLTNVIRSAALDLLIRGVRERDQDLIALFWDLQYIIKFGLLPPPRLVLPQPQPDPSPIDSIRLHEELLVGLVDVVAGDPNPQPNLPSLGSFLRDKAIRLKAAEGLAKRLEAALGHLKEEITALKSK